MSDPQARALRPDRLFALPSGLWVLDAFQPVAAVLEPDGAVRRLVSWPELPPADGPDQRPEVRSDGAGLWTQQQASGPLVRVGVDGVTTTAWTGGLLLAACGPGVAWCSLPPRNQELVAGPDPHPVGGDFVDRLLRVAADGVCSSVLTEHPVRAVQADALGLLVRVDVGGWTLGHLGADTYEVQREARWLRLPWDERLPERLTVAEHGLAEGFVPGNRVDAVGWGPFTWHEDPTLPDEQSQPRPVTALGLTWRFGWDLERSEVGRRAVASAHTIQGDEVRRWDLGVGTVQSVTPVGDCLAVVLCRDVFSAPRTPVGGRVVLVDPRADATVLLADDRVDITDLGWPLPPRPLGTDSFLAQILTDNGRLEHYWNSVRDGPGQPLAAGMSHVRTTLAGDWPHTHLEWTFSYLPHPGLILRRRVPLFDELGRPDPPFYADINLMEDLDTRNLPPVSEARDGVLDI